MSKGLDCCAGEAKGVAGWTWAALAVLRSVADLQKEARRWGLVGGAG